MIIPISFNDQIEIDLAEFITQYYIFVLNLFIVIGFGIWINRKVNTLENELSREKNLLEAKILTKKILTNLENSDIKSLKVNWIKFKRAHRKYERKIDSKMNKFIESLNSHNFESKKSNPIYSSILKYLKEYE